MKRIMLKSKIHRATLTGLELDYEGSIAIDDELLKLADILPGEQVQVLNLSNGVRLTTYAIRAEAGSRTIMLNGPAARLGAVGDQVIILTYCQMGDDELESYNAKIIKVDRENNPLA